MPVYDDEINLRPYILTIVQHWWQILLVAGIAVVLALAYSLTRSSVYESTATILIDRSRATLNLAEQFPTVNDPVDPRSRIDSMLSIAQNDALVLDVIQTAGNSLPADERDPDSLRNHVQLSNKGDLILITASDNDPQNASKIANIWAEKAVEGINAAYSDEQPLATIQSQEQSTRQSYEKSQSALEAFIRDNKIDLLKKQIAEAQALFNQLAADRSYQIAYYTNRKQSMEDLKVQAEALKQQLQGGSVSQAGILGDGLAVLMARAHALGVNLNTVTDQKNITTENTANNPTDPNQNQDNSNPYNYNFTPQAGNDLNLQIGDITALKDSSTNYVADLNTLITLSQNEITKADDALKTLTEQVNGGQDPPVVDTTASRIRDLQSQLENEQARQQDLTSQRDIAWKAYQALAQKDTELRTATQTTNQVTMAGSAVPPEKPTSRGIVRNTSIAAFLGILIGIGLVIASFWWRSSNETAPAVNPR